ncbi:MAG TPA: hypothetical protein VFW90_02205, partial [Candidatus Saccharimonadales bacterium]|nr:hypothetical protein [Candidatus Saccharimonadales bacterium]
MAVPEARINQLPDLSVAIEPYYGYDPKYRQLVIGEVRLSEAIAVHPYIEILLAKNRVREDDTHEPNNTTNLRELLLGNTEFTRGPRQENPYRNLSLAQYHDYGSWILYVCDKVNTNTMNNSANLWLGPSTNMLRKSGHV